jgi:hypothetical protein
MVLNIDLAPTLLDLAGLPAPKEMQGRSWKPFLTSGVAGWRRAFLYEYFLEADMGPPTVLALRTEEAKLIKYPGHDDWTELYGLGPDPGETRNLAAIPEQKQLLKAMLAAFDREAKAVEFHVPDYADKPGEVQARAGKQSQHPKRLNAYVLDLEFAKAEGNRVPDASGRENHGAATAIEVVHARGEKRAALLDGRGFIEVARSRSLDCAGGAWSIEAVLKPAKPAGVIVARGGKLQGYALYLDGGRPALAVTAGGRTTTLTGPKPITGKWTHLAGVIGNDRSLLLYVNGEVAASSALPKFISRDPTEAMQVGADEGSAVTAYPEPMRFAGLLEAVRIYSGELPAQAIQKAACEAQR